MEVRASGGAGAPRTHNGCGRAPRGHIAPFSDPTMDNFRELLAKLHIAREHMTSEYRLHDLVVALVA